MKPPPETAASPAPAAAPAPAPSWFRQALVKGSIMVATALVCLVILEVGLRWMGRYAMDNKEGYFASGGISYVLKSNVTKKVVWPSMSFTVHTSDRGYRAKAPGRQAIGERPYYVVMGASDVFGNGLDYEETFVGIFDEKMKRHGFDVVNLGIAGHHLLEQEALFRDLAGSVKRPPQAVLIVFNPLFIGGYDDIHPDVMVKRGDLFEGSDWRIHFLRKTLANTSASYCFFRDGIRKSQQRFMPREDFALSFYLDRFSSKHRIHQPEKSADFLSRLGELEGYIRGLGSEIIEVYCPPAGVFQVNDLVAKGKIEPSLVDTKFFVDIVRNHCQEKGIRFITLEPPVQKRYDAGEKLNFESDGHYNGPTSKLVGDYLYDLLRPDRPKGS